MLYHGSILLERPYSMNGNSCKPDSPNRFIKEEFIRRIAEQVFSYPVNNNEICRIHIL